VLQTWFKRQKYGVNKMTPAIFADQQKIADAFFKLGVIPTKIDVTQAAWTA
jgi:sulfonate transport system substrate-binding protein